MKQLLCVALPLILAALFLPFCAYAWIEYAVRTVFALHTPCNHFFVT